MSDEVILEIEDNILKCNRQQLIDNSDYFKVMFQGGFIESHKERITLKEVNFNAMKIVVSLLSDKDYIIPQVDLYSVLQTVCMLQFLSLKLLVTEMLSKFLNYDTCLKTWLVCEELDIKPLYVCAKTMSLMEFDHIKNGTLVTELTHSQLCIYLGNRNLRCKSELDVFQVAMIWWYQNCKNYEPLECQKILIRLLYCVDFFNATISDIKEMKLYPDIVDSPVIQEIMDCMLVQKKFLIREDDIADGSTFSDSTQQIVKTLLSSKPRILSEYPCIIVQPLDVNVDVKMCKFIKLIEIFLK